jgi:formyl-CoA transferase
LPFKQSRTPGDPTRAPGPGLGEHTAEVLAEAGYSNTEIDALLGSGAVAGPADAVQSGTFMA